jgi:hypothetical protein
LKGFTTGPPHIAESLSWASIAEANTKISISAWKAAQCITRPLEGLLKAAIFNKRKVFSKLKRIFEQNKSQARRAHPQRDHKEGICKLFPTEAMVAA